MAKTIDVIANLTGIVWQVDVAAGDRVAEDDPIITLESMKMEIPVCAPEDGEVVEILVGKDDPVEEGQVIARLSAA
ncbi:acetyl-CoA carboxylase biotin carboxyl carrier protein subunit [Aquamicrobium zhengzhouense]|uniref:Acetyl-CoA carboxylase biotin carboxyl carrier protein subunit n=1 Tax=Aquamicrobium zhengzhouense TaxID=2781738 RepID=A0ABS0SFV9_9HYPH|nr:acetyl-CoA carboxylase biotin carboxyl carrier protein subunit [Aquamicrobium zhengzhouense]MBI1621669.1 acetyl-CoA carboxylase biotin carboxyl carrier protein subunit [Aquamicrobium zhengzhouense]